MSRKKIMLFMVAITVLQAWLINPSFRSGTRDAEIGSGIGMPHYL